jgi:hypothetical protein
LMRASPAEPASSPHMFFNLSPTANALHFHY